jgi:L-iditol 2-dehydrogenase
MKALRLYGPDDLRLEEVEKPTAPRGGMVLKVDACAICGSDLRNVKAGGSAHKMKMPAILGHEFAGTIVELGEGVTDYEIGEKVVSSAIIPCGHCRYCLRGLQNLCVDKNAISYITPGAFAEYVMLPALHVANGGVHRVPEGFTTQDVCITEPCSCALNGQEISKVGLGDVVCVIGAGPLGIIHCLMAKVLGASKVISVDIMQNRVDQARSFPEIDVAVNSATEDLKAIVDRETDGYGCDVVIVASPSGKAQEQAIEIAGRRGRVNLFGGLPKGSPPISVDSNVVHYKEIYIQGTSDSSNHHMDMVLDMFKSGQLDPRRFITHRYPLSQYKEAFAMAQSGNALKVIIYPD